jgi:very-short-patch-repair endonuclease
LSDKSISSNFGKALRRNGTPAERVLWSKLRNRQIGGIKFRRQQPIEHYIVDFVNFEIKLVIEIDGGQHNEDITIIRDEERTAYLNCRGYRVIRFWNNEVMDNLDGVLTKIREVAEDTSPSPFGSSPVEGEED